MSQTHPVCIIYLQDVALTLILLTCRIWWAPRNASRWQMEFNSAFKGLKVEYMFRPSSLGHHKVVSLYEETIQYMIKYVKLNHCCSTRSPFFVYKILL